LLAIISDQANLEFLLNKTENFDVNGRHGRWQTGKELAREKATDVILLDIKMRPMSRLRCIENIRKFSPGSKVIGVFHASQPACGESAHSLCSAWAAKHFLA